MNVTRSEIETHNDNMLTRSEQQDDARQLLNESDWDDAGLPEPSIENWSTIET